MNEAFHEKLLAKLNAFREWSRTRSFEGCRLVQYCGVEKLRAIDVPDEGIEPRIEGLVCVGFFVDWAGHGGRLYLRVWEYDGPEPPWPKVFAEDHLQDMESLLED